MSAHSTDSNILIANSECETYERSPGTGASLCNSLRTSFYPHIVYGEPGNLKDYDGDHDFASLEAFVKRHAGPGPSPGPSPKPPSPTPPSPTPPSPTPPTPSTAHYEKPPCQSDEIKVEVQGISGKLCAPSCTNEQCPRDVPSGVSARPQCILQDSSGSSYCALVCSSDTDCDTAGGASCQALENYGLCTYSEFENSKTCPVRMRPTNNTLVVV